MPIYEYRCQECGVEFEKLVRSVGDDGVSCPVCLSAEVVRKLSVFATSVSGTSGGCCAPGGG